MSRLSRYAGLNRERFRNFSSRKKAELVSLLLYWLRGRLRPGYIFLQTSDSECYARMLAVSAKSVRRYCAIHGYEYRAFIGIKRGYHPWQATFNRIVMLKELMDEGFRGWAVYIDADAYIHDATIAVSALTHGVRRPLIIERGGDGKELWDSNAGVFLLDLGQPKGRDLVWKWHRAFMEVSDAALKSAVEWGDDDQTLLQRILREQIVPDAVERPLPGMLNYDGSFVRQELREDGSFEARLAAITRGVEAMLAASAERPATPEQ